MKKEVWKKIKILKNVHSKNNIEQVRKHWELIKINYNIVNSVDKFIVDFKMLKIETEIERHCTNVKD